MDTTITIGTQNVPLRFKYSATRLQDETIPTILQNFDCKKFLMKWNVKAFTVIDLLTLSDTIWIAPDNWIVQDIIPGQYIDNLGFLGVDPFSILGLDTRLTDEIVNVANDESVPNDFILGQNYPNPFNPSTTIKYTIPTSEFVTLKIYDVLGKEVAALVNEEKPAGSYEEDFNAAGFSSGIYFYTINAGSFIETKKMIFIK